VACWACVVSRVCCCTAMCSPCMAVGVMLAAGVCCTAAQELAPRHTGMQAVLVVVCQHHCWRQQTCHRWLTLTPGVARHAGVRPRDTCTQPSSVRAGTCLRTCLRTRLHVQAAAEVHAQARVHTRAQAGPEHGPVQAKREHGPALAREQSRTAAAHTRLQHTTLEHSTTDGSVRGAVNTAGVARSIQHCTHSN
jgi:hypothetical protein